MTSGAAGALLDLKGEIETMIGDKLERFFAKGRFVTREEFEVVRGMAQKAREENAALRADIEKLKS